MQSAWVAAAEAIVAGIETADRAATHPHASVEPARVGRTSLRFRLGSWNVAVFTATLAVFTALGIAAERRNLDAVARAEAHAFLTHLAEMPQFRSDRASAETALSPLRDSMRAAGGDLVLAMPGAPRDTGLVVTQPLILRDGSFELRYRSDPSWLQMVARRSVLLHLFHGVLALVALLLGTDLILRRRLVAPLAHIAHELELMARGWGWSASLPAADQELARLSHAITGLGPSLTSQVQQWVDAERRAAAGTALQEMRLRLREPRRRAYALLGDLQARELVTPQGIRKVRLLLTELDRIAAVIDEEEKERCDPAPSPESSAAPA